MTAAIVAVNEDWGIGYNGDLLEYIPDDLKMFRQITDGGIVVMGSKTWDSLPNKPLTNRLNLVISRQPRNIPGSLSISLEEAKVWLTIAAADQEEKLFVIGGGWTYKELLPYCDRVYVTKIYKSHENVDTYFPNLDESEEWAPASCGAPQTHGDITYQFWEYDRIS